MKALGNTLAGGYEREYPPATNKRIAPILIVQGVLWLQGRHQRLRQVLTPAEKGSNDRAGDSLSVKAGAGNPLLTAMRLRQAPRTLQKRAVEKSRGDQNL